MSPVNGSRPAAHRSAASLPDRGPPTRATTSPELTPSHRLATPPPSGFRV
jgi:hypothetical protein